MSGRNKFSELEAKMPPARRARIRRLAEKLDKKVETAQEAAKTQGGGEPSDQTLAARSGAAG
jgi:hypothetical protein